MANVSEKPSKLGGYVQLLEDELTKIHAFKRELPLCMLLLTDAIQRLKEQTKQYERTEVQRGMEEFIPMVGNSEKNGGIKASSDVSDKKNWLSSAQLWITSNVKCENSYRDTNERVTVPSLKLRDREEDGSATGNLFQVSNFRSSRVAFEQFKKRPSAPVVREDKAAEMGSIDLNLEGNSSGSDSSLVTDQMKPQSKPKQQQKQLQQKKQRRCWSSELHRRFVDALQQLGGPQSATPKHIRELMQVDGLTNDEVKSHLQKYRIHVKKLSVSSSLPATSAVPVLWMSRDQCGDVSKANPSQSGSPTSPF